MNELQFPYFLTPYKGVCILSIFRTDKTILSARKICGMERSQTFNDSYIDNSPQSQYLS